MKMPKPKRHRDAPTNKKNERRRRDADANELSLRRDREKSLADWVPRTELGRLVKNGEITSMDDVYARNLPVLEPEIVDSLLELSEKMVDFQKTTRVIRAGRMFSFRAAVLVGDRNGHVGLGTGKDKEKYPALRKATRQAKLSLIRVERGSGSWQEQVSGTHSVPFAVEGHSASVRVKFIPAPRGTGLVVGDAIKDVLRFAGITDVWAQTKGNTRTNLNFIRAAIDALSKTTRMKASQDMSRKRESVRKG